MKKISIRKEVLLIGIHTVLTELLGGKQKDPAYEEELSFQLTAIRTCNVDTFEVLIPTDEQEEINDV
jgi:hypothetical protein